MLPRFRVVFFSYLYFSNIGKLLTKDWTTKKDKLRKAAARQYYKDVLKSIFPSINQFIFIGSTTNRYTETM